jgi:cell division protein FtsN
MKKPLILFVFAGVLAMSSCKYFEKHRLFSKDVDTLLDAVATNPVVTNQIIDTTPIISEPTAAPAPVVKQTGFGYGSDKYYMIVGSFQNQNLAEKYAEKIQKMGYQTQIIESPSGFYRVSAKSYNNYKTGIKDLEDFRTNVTANAWLHVHK